MIAEKMMIDSMVGIMAGAVGREGDENGEKALAGNYRHLWENVFLIA